jgi:hypothetical protein
VDLFQRLLHGVVHFRHFDFGHYIKGVVGHTFFAIRFGGFGLRTTII